MEMRFRGWAGFSFCWIAILLFHSFLLVPDSVTENTAFRLPGLKLLRLKEKDVSNLGFRSATALFRAGSCAFADCAAL